ncbi:MAG: hypothetical protein O2816_18095, partial [Planctomycetota bacterium]|nr:hypothetical protein [Planctomycetota bacterium]
PLAQDGGIHKDERFGFKFKPPKKWNSIALKTDEAWLVAKYVSEKADSYHDKNLGYTYLHKPELMVIAFQHEIQDRKREVTEEEEDGVKVTTITISNPYKDYEDFLKRTYAGGGWFVEKTSLDDDKTYKVGDLEYEWYEVKVEKGARTGPKRILTWIFKTEDIDYAMQTEVLYDEFDTYKNTLERSLKSFVEIERNGELLPKGGATTGAVRITRRELTSGTPKERRTVRMKSQRELQDKAIAGLPEDWDHSYHGDVLVLNHNQSKWSQRLGDHAEQYLKWIEKTFDYYGKGEYARAPVIRVCENQEEENAFSRGAVSGSGGNMVYVFPGSEITTHKDDAGFIGFEVGWVNRMILSLWLAERDEDLTSALPEWIRTGLFSYVDGARADGRNIDFRVDQWAKDGARLAVSKGTASSPRDIIGYTREEFRADTGGGASASAYFGRSAQSAMLVRFLLSNESRRCKQAKDLLEKYLLTVKEVVDEIKGKEKDTWEASAAPQTEEEEAEMAKARNGRWQAREKELMDETFDRVFGEWSDRDWESFEKAFFDWL